MIVIFVSECEKKARSRTLQVLDSFAERIGQSTWKARLTLEGLKAIKILLSKSATRQTSVSCHRVRSRMDTELLWIIGNKSKFNHLGIYSTNYTKTDAIRWVDNDWHYLELLKISVALAGLFHDWGKSWDSFQDMLREKSRDDYIRHEYVSLVLWSCIVKGRAPNEWLSDLESAADLDENKLIAEACDFSVEKSPFLLMRDDLSKMIGWLIVSHHLQPDPAIQSIAPCATSAALLDQINFSAGYMKNITERPKLAFSRGLPCRSVAWCKQVKKWARRGIQHLEALNVNSKTGEIILRPIAHLARAALMIGDHEASRRESIPANVDPPQRHSTEKQCHNLLLAKSLAPGLKVGPVLLDRHLLEVTREALSFCHLYPYMETELPHVDHVGAISRRSAGDFSWQDRAADAIRKKINETGARREGFLALNMAATGTGKTFGNAKIMNAVQSGRLRYTLALGLRSLTLQTGDEYRRRIGLDETELAVVIGSKAVRELHESRNNQKSLDDDSANWMLDAGWEEISFASPVLDEKLSTKLTSKKSRQILYSPILVCTIDHIIGATEETRRGRHIIPWLRMISADLVIDEVDDFDGDDLIAICRLVHLAGMLGRNVVLSSATIPPAVAESAYAAYSNGWRLFAASRGRSQTVTCAWIDESLGARVQTIADETEFTQCHEKYIRSRIKKLRQQPVRRKAELRDVCPDNFGDTAISAAMELHHRHCQEVADKKVSFGVIRMANISPCVAMARYCLRVPLPQDIAIRILPYHSRFPRISRHFMEMELDAVLNRKDAAADFKQLKIQEHLGKIKEKNILFIVIATPVEEVGRDHDFDWAVLEPSSFRSLIQMAGRVFRHRTPRRLSMPNIIVLSHNINALMNKEIAYTRPGYESGTLMLASHDLRQIVDEKVIQDRVDSAARINRVKNPRPESSLIDLEHASLDKLLLGGNAKAYDTPIGWNLGPWHLSNVAQKIKPFRKGEKEISFYIAPEAPHWGLKFYLQDENGAMHARDQWVRHEHLTPEEEKRLWLPVHYIDQLEDIRNTYSLSLSQAVKRFGEISVPRYIIDNLNHQPVFNPDLGLWVNKPFSNLFQPF